MNKIVNNNSIAILMATYNGAKYLSEQIDSIINQTCSDWKLYIQDDGSTDSTIQIIEEYARRDRRIILVDVGLSRQGAGLNFMNLLNMVESDYYMFSDQDDVWFSNKIEISLARMKKEEALHPNTPVLIHTDRTHTDANLNVKMQSEFNPRNLPYARIEAKIDKLKDPNILRIYTIAGGCTMMLNKLVKRFAIPFVNVRVHDSICAMATANNSGVISTILEPTMYYRLHGGNTCGVSSNKIMPKLFNIINTISGNLRGFYIWKIYGGGNFFKFLYWRVRYFMILRMN